MKAYIMYIATLLAALVLPATAQTGSTDTKAAPDYPSMPYRLTVNTIGGNHGKVDITDKDGKGGIVIIAPDTLVYGNQVEAKKTTVALTVTPNAVYTLRKDYPKAYKTGDATTKVTIAADGTFKMPSHPVTIEIAYADNIKSVAAITLKEEVTADNVVSKLPRYVHFALSSGRKDSIAVTNWAFSKSGVDGDNTTFDIADGAVNRFSYTAATLPDSITDSDNKLTSTILVANMAKPLKPGDVKGKEITISGGTGDNLNGQVDTGSKEPFNGTIGDGSSTTVKSLEVSSDVKDATLTLNSVIVADDISGGGTTTIKDGADLTLKIEGTNNLGTLTVESGATIILDKAEGAKLEGTIQNAGTFRDSTATVTKVTGDGALDINAALTGGSSVTTNTPVTLTATTNDANGTTSFIWQRKNADGSYTEVQRKAYDKDGNTVTKAVGNLKDEYKPATASTGTTLYRCLIERTVSGGGGASATTLLSTQPAKVEVKSGGGNPTPDPDPPYIPTPDPTPTYYTVTLPSGQGFTTTPAAGRHQVEEGDLFTFSLTLSAGYDSKTLVVSTSRSETLQPQASDGKYVISKVDRDITVSIAVNPVPAGNATVEADAIRVWTTTGTLHISTPLPAPLDIYTLSGQCLRRLNLPAGDSRITLPTGLYLLRMADRQRKVFVR